MYANIALPVPLDQIFSYEVPEHLREQAVPGMRVLVPFGKRQLEGVIVEHPDRPEVEQVKLILDCLDAEPIFSPDMLALTRWMADYYLATWGQALKCAIPAGLSLIRQRIVSVTKAITPDEIEQLRSRAPVQAEILSLASQKPIAVARLRQSISSGHVYAALATCETRGWIAITDRIQRQAQPKTVIGMRLTVSPEEARGQLSLLDRKAPKQAAVLRYVLDHQMDETPLRISTLAAEAGTTPGTISALERKGLLRRETVIQVRDPVQAYAQEEAPAPTLTTEQQRALEPIVEAIEQSRPDTFLLHGVTGSGKTEVYIHSIARALELGRTAIVLVPEISLTPQTVSRFAARFGERITVLHSQLSQGERYDQWQRARRGEVDIVVGPRSAVFAPLDRLGLIVIDEEHETTYKQDDPAPRYHAREVAIRRAELADATVVLGTATPALESFYRARQNQYRLLSMPTRVHQAPLPPVKVVDMREELKVHQNRTIFSTVLRQAIEDRLERQEQTILFLNRRGHSTYVFCRECGYVEECTNCSITMTYHFNSQKLVCHHCNEERPAPKGCPRCRSGYIRYLGLGTQQVEEEVRRAFPTARVARMDTDSTTGKNAHQKILQAFRAGELDLLIGTQMVAKGLDFPRVTLVGVILADTALHLPDFRSGERTFNLLTQVAGRAGRSAVGGDVILQSYQPDNYAIAAASQHDYERFYEEEIRKREEVGYPPATHALSVLVHGESETSVQTACHTLEAILLRLQDSLPEVIVLGPAPAPLTRIRGRYRWHFLLKAVEPAQLRRIARQMLAESPPTITRGDVEVVLNMDPMTVL